MKKILVTGAGGTPATNFVRSLRSAPEPVTLVGTDSDKYYLMRAETDEAYLVPPAGDPAYLSVLSQIITETGCEFLHVQNDVEMEVISAHRDELRIRTFLPANETVRMCLDKHATYERWAAAGIPQPRTILVNDESALRLALKSFSRVWLRDTRGAGGRGSIAVDEFAMAKAWVDFHGGWGRFTAAECLRPESVTWMSLWNQGRLVVAIARKRLYWEFGNLAPSGVSGVTGTGITYSRPELDRLALRAIRAVDTKPHGIFSVDMAYDSAGVPNPTEINIGRFFTTHEFFTQAGVNMPYMLIQLAFGEELAKVDSIMNPIRENLAWIRGVDFLPVLTTTEKIEENVADLDARLARLADATE